MDLQRYSIKINKGVPYINAKQENTIMESLTDGNINFYNPNDKNKYKNITIFKDEDKLKYEDFCKTFTEFLYSENKNWIFEKFQKFFIYYIINNIPDNIRKRLYFSYEKLDGKQFFMISKLDEEEKKFKLDLEVQDKMKEFNKKKGARKIFEAIVKRKCSIIGHNFTMDLLFTISHLGDPLPNTLKDFKDMLKNYFSAVYDTKYLFQNFSNIFKVDVEDISNTHLENVYTYLKNKFADQINIKLHDNFKGYYSADSGVYHEAAFDAYVTGAAFIWMAENLKGDVLKFSNKVFLMKSIYSCFNLEGEEPYFIPNVYIII